MPALFGCALAWRPGIGDPTVLGWIAAVAYALAAALSARLALGRSRPGSRSRSRIRPRDAAAERAFWALAALALAGLALNKQLDLQTLLMQAARCAAQAQGWYAERREVQGTVIRALAAAALLGGALLLLMLRRTLARTGPAIAGLGILVVWIVLRASLFNHVELPGGSAGLRGPWVELGGIALFALGAVRARAVRAKER